MTGAFILFDRWFWHPYTGKGYQWWSGLGSDLTEVSVLVGLAGVLVAFWRHHNCHVKGCPLLAWHPHPEHGHPVCRRHHPHTIGRP